MKSKNEIEKDNTLIPVSFRLPKYLIEFINKHHDPIHKISKSDIFRTFLDILHSNEWIVEKFKNNEKIVPDSVYDLEDQVEDLKNQMFVHNSDNMERNKTLERKFISLEAKMEFQGKVIEKLLGISMEQVIDAPEQVIEQIYEEYIENLRKG